MKKCKYCNGQGKVNVFLAEDNEVTEVCPVCDGKGKIPKSRKIDIKIPLRIG